MNYRLGIKSENSLLTAVKSTSNTTAKHPFSQASPKVRYVLEGGIIKVLKTDDKGQERCVKTIPIRAASLSILNQVECTNLADAMLLEEVKREKAGKSDTCGNYDKNGLTDDSDSSEASNTNCETAIQGSENAE
jgi:hypothetical protein